MPLQRLRHEDQGSGLVALLRHEALKDLSFLVDRAPQVDHLPIDLHVHLVEVPVPEAAHAAHPLPPDVAGEQRPEPVPPHPHRLATQVDPALEQQIFHVPQAQWLLHVHQYHQADHFR